MERNIYDVRAGDIWQEVDNRLDRKVEVLAISGDYALIHTVGALDKTATTWALLNRFNGKSHNYRFIRRGKAKEKGKRND